MDEAGDDQLEELEKELEDDAGLGAKVGFWGYPWIQYPDMP